MAAAAALLDATAFDGGARRRLELRSEAALPQPPQQRKLWVAAIGRHVSPLSCATLLQLKLLSAAFQLCPQPTCEQIDALARHVSLEPEELVAWFQSRRVLQEWVQQPCGAQLQPASLAKLFYPEASTIERE